MRLYEPRDWGRRELVEIEALFEPLVAGNVDALAKFDAGKWREVVAARVHGWRDIMGENGEPFLFTEENCRELLNGYCFILDAFGTALIECSVANKLTGDIVAAMN